MEMEGSILSSTFKNVSVYAIGLSGQTTQIESDQIDCSRQSRVNENEQHSSASSIKTNQITQYLRKLKEKEIQASKQLNMSTSLFIFIQFLIIVTYFELNNQILIAQAVTPGSGKGEFHLDNSKTHLLHSQNFILELISANIFTVFPPKSKNLRHITGEQGNQSYDSGDAFRLSKNKGIIEQFNSSPGKFQ